MTARRLLHTARDLSTRRSVTIWIIVGPGGHWIAVRHCQPGRTLICRVMGVDIVKAQRTTP